MSGQSENNRFLDRFVGRQMQAGAESAVVTSAGAKAAAMAAKIKGLSSYNFYRVRVIEIGDAGSLPVEIGDEFEAVNLAESFLSQGQLSAGATVVVCRVGSSNVFYVKP
jgi:hypothetical protein